MADVKMKKDPMMEAVGFNMINLKSFPFARLPGEVQVEVIGEFDFDKEIELFNVSMGFREYFARNGIFGRHVQDIYLNIGVYGEKNDFEIQVRKVCSCRVFDSRKDRVLFRNISSCDRLLIFPLWRFDENGRYIQRATEELITTDALLNDMSDWFPNLRFVERSSVKGYEGDEEFERVFESFHFKVTKYADFVCCQLAFLESRRWEHLLANQLSICKHVFFRNSWSHISKVPQEISGMTIENDPKKKSDIFEAFTKLPHRSTSLNNVLHEFFFLCYHPPVRVPPIHCYRRKIDGDNEMLMLVWSSIHDQKWEY